MAATFASLAPQIPGIKPSTPCSPHFTGLSLSSPAFSLFPSTLLSASPVLLQQAEEVSSPNVVLAPPFVYIYQVKNSLADRIEIAAQNSWIGKSGAFTGILHDQKTGCTRHAMLIPLSQK